MRCWCAVTTEHGADFAALMGRLHPAASSVARLAREQPAQLVLFDALAVGNADVRKETFDDRRRALEALSPRQPSSVTVTPITRDGGSTSYGASGATHMNCSIAGRSSSLTISIRTPSGSR